MIGYKAGRWAKRSLADPDLRRADDHEIYFATGSDFADGGTRLTDALHRLN